MFEKHEIESIAGSLWDKSVELDSSVESWLDTETDDDWYWTACHKVVYRCLSILFMDHKNLHKSDVAQILRLTHPFIAEMENSVFNEHLDRLYEFYEDLY